MKTDPNEKPLDGTTGKSRKASTDRQILDAQMFTVTAYEAKYLNYNPRPEKHGDEDVPAADLKFELIGPHSMIECFGEGLRDFLFREPGVGEDAQTTLDLGGDKRTKVKYRECSTLPWDAEFPGYTVTVSTGLDTGESLVFNGAKLKAFKFQAMDGGAVKITLSAAVYPDEAQSGKLFVWQKKTLVLTLERPKAASEQAALH